MHFSVFLARQNCAKIKEFLIEDPPAERNDTNLSINTLIEDVKPKVTDKCEFDNRHFSNKYFLWPSGQSIYHRKNHNT